ncbi:MAG TPA: AAA family ATPase [Methanothrix sp.]|nr:AAA family ATPase [Methanothrix sp.]
MISNLKIKNFKSIKQLNLKCNKKNLFIGEPNAGKSNILEALGMFSFIRFGKVEDFVRLESMTNLFHDENLDEVLSIEADSKVLEIAFKDDLFQGQCYDKESNEKEFSFSIDIKLRGSLNMFKEPFPIRFYRFSLRKEFFQKEAEFLLPPSGDNLLTIIRSHKKIKEAITDLLAPFNLKLVFRLQENKIEIMKQQQNEIVTYPYWLLSDTLQRIIFYTTAIDSNKDSILIFEEPESNSFPYYTKFLGEKIAFDETNQYFIATHNPYLLLAILEKSKKNSVNVFVTYYRDYETKVKLLDEEQISELMDFDPFFNLDDFIRG